MIIIFNHTNLAIRHIHSSTFPIQYRASQQSKAAILVSSHYGSLAFTRNKRHAMHAEAVTLHVMKFARKKLT